MFHKGARKSPVIFAYFSFILFSGCTYCKELNTTALTHFIDCVTSSDISYDYAVENDGYLRLQPTNGYSLSDSEYLYQCFRLADYPVKLMVYEKDDSTLKNSHPLNDSSVPDLIMLGVEPFENSQSPLGLSKRKNTLSLLLFNVYADEIGNDCENSDLFYCEPDTCYSKNAFYKSIKAENPYTGLELQLSIYPHHDCIEGPRTIVVPPGRTSGCEARNTYSWHGVFVEPPPPPIACLAPLFNCIVGGKNGKNVANSTKLDKNN